MDNMTTATTPCTRCLLEKLQENITNEIQVIQIMKILYSQRETDEILVLYRLKTYPNCDRKANQKSVKVVELKAQGLSLSKRTAGRTHQRSVDHQQIHATQQAESLVPAVWAITLHYVAINHV